MLIESSQLILQNLNMCGQVRSKRQTQDIQDIKITDVLSEGGYEDFDDINY